MWMEFAQEQPEEVDEEFQLQNILNRGIYVNATWHKTLELKTLVPQQDDVCYYTTRTAQQKPKKMTELQVFFKIHQIQILLRYRGYSG